MATLLCGTDAPLEPGDGSGMNLMNLARGTWDLSCVAATALGRSEPKLAKARRAGCGPRVAGSAT